MLNLNPGDVFPNGTHDFGLWLPNIAGPALVESLAVLDHIAASIPSNGVFLEMGTWGGGSAAYIATLRPDVTIVSDDTFIAHGVGPGLWWLNARPNMHLFVGSTEAFCGLCKPATFDAVLIDAGHDEPDVARDFRLAEAIVKPGGVLFGHDYGMTNWPGVTPAIDAFCNERGWAITSRVDSLVALRRAERAGAS